ncbi:MAG: TIGR00725 family protein, partial [Nitrospirota bacterium]
MIGGGECTEHQAAVAEAVGRGIAGAGWILYTGGLGGVMEAASRGARGVGGRVVGVLPGGEPGSANPYVEVPIATGMGHARNVVLIQSVDAVIAVGGSHGTLSEIAIALKLGRPVLALESWEIPGVEAVASPAAAIARLGGEPPAPPPDAGTTSDPFLERLTALCQSIPGRGGEELATALHGFDGSHAGFLSMMRLLGKHHEAIGS